MKKLTPIRAIRAKCLSCCLDQPKEARLCAATTCPVWPYRLGKRPIGPKDATSDGLLTPIKSIRAKCLDCSEGPKEVRDCHIDCAVWPYRMGRRPRLQPLEVNVASDGPD